ncbi:hypothetical protein [Yoonia sp.]|uniref:hypothetical protein n=1 Tax=Yoonia sp. TaxID=2212373 RepID=UPI003267AC4B
MAKPIDPLTGAFRLGTDMTLADIWTGLHSDAQMWQRSAFAADTLQQRASINDNTKSLLTALAPCPATRWQAFIEAQGVTQIGAIALSWCADVELSTVADLFLREISCPADIDKRAAQRLNPALLPSTRSLSELAASAQSDIKTLVLMCLGQATPITFDVSAAWLQDLPAIVGAILLERYDPAVSQLDPNILSTWQAAA